MNAVVSHRQAELELGLDVDIVICDEVERHTWETYLERSPASSVCHRFLWQSIIKQAYGHQPLYLLARTGAHVRGVLPLVVVKSRLFGKSLVSMPFLDYGGVCADDEDTAKRLVSHALQLIPVCGVDSVELRQRQPPTHAGVVRLDKVGMQLDLSRGIEKVWQSFPAKVRNQVRKAEKAGLQASIGGGELLDEFYSFFVVNMRDLGSPVHSKKFFATMFAQFGEQARIVLVREGQQPIGGLVCLFFKKTATVPWASSLRQFLAKCPNNLAYWEAMQYASARGCTMFDFGRSSIDSGTYNFKRQWGAEPVQLYWQILDGNEKSARLRQSLQIDNSKLQLAAEIWRRLPVSVTRVVGPRLRKYITN
jgi:FemAB-related protein (PEP-CTERM system-associated)